MSILDTFMFGTATSSYQIEGAYNEGNRSSSIWDDFSAVPGKVQGMDNGNVACDHYHRYKEDVQIIKELGVDIYRFSIAWPRIFPEKGKFNKEGMDFYINLINELKANGIKSCVTLYHWDLPSWIQEEGGWTSRKSVEYFKEYSKVCFEYLDDLVEGWITINEPWCAAMLGYCVGVHAPGHTSIEEGMKATHHLLLAHGEAMDYYKNVFKGTNPIGITLNLNPVDQKEDDYNGYVARNARDGFLNRIYLDPIFKGSYPTDMINLFSHQIKDFSFIQDGDLEKISIENDFLGINYYSRNLVVFDENSELLYRETADDNIKQTAMGWEVVPQSLKELIYRLRKEYTQLPILITENGAAYDDKLEDGEIHDKDRCDYIEQHINAVKELNEEGMNIKGYYLWSLLDNFEWAFGYAKRFGIVYVDFEDNQKRYLKDSAKLYKKIVSER